MHETSTLRFCRENTLWQTPEKKTLPFWMTTAGILARAESMLSEKLRSSISLEVKKRGGKEVVYDGYVKAAPVTVWKIFDKPCGQRLAPPLKTEVDRLRQQEEIFISNEVREELKRISPRTIARALKR